MNILVKIAMIMIFIYITKTFLFKYYHKDLYILFLQYISRPISRYQGRYFMKNFDKIIEPFFVGDIKKRNNIININRNEKNQYSLLDKSITNGILPQLKKRKPDKKALNILLKRILNYIHLDGKKVNFDDLIYVDVMTIPGNYFPFFHTDIEWDTFNDSNGFQAWILLEEDEEIKPRGNMFLLETDYVKNANIIKVLKNKVEITDNKSKFFPKVLKTFKSLKEISPKISYLNPKIGEVFIMNPLLYHCSDPLKVHSTRRAMNFRILHKPTKTLKIFSPDNNYSRLVIDKHNVKMKKNFGVLNFDNKKGRFKIM